MIGIYLLIRGGLQGQAILLLSPTDALHLIELLLNTAPGTVTLGELERSALARRTPRARGCQSLSRRACY
jgi:chemotaxis protein CheY-P-specific phosphatase CheC